MYKVEFYQPTIPKKIFDIDIDNYDSMINGASSNLEKNFSNIVNYKYILSVSNPTSAIHLAMCAIDLKRGDKVICPINSYADVPQAIRHFDSEPIFTDIEPRSYLMSLESLKYALKNNKSKKLRAIVVSHFAGLHYDISDIVALAKENKVLVIEDFSDVTILNKNIKILGDIAIFSLNYKHDNTLKGAIVAFKDEKIFKRANLTKELGVKLYNKDINYLYDVIEIGCDYRLDNLSAYLLDGFIKDRKELYKKKMKIVDIYFKELDNLKHITLPIKDKNHSYSYFIIEVDKNRDLFAKELKKRGIEVALHYIPLNFTTYYKDKYNLKVFSFPNALSMYQKVLSIPNHCKMSIDDAMQVCRAIKEVDSIHI